MDTDDGPAGGRERPDDGRDPARHRLAAPALAGLGVAAALGLLACGRGDTTSAGRVPRTLATTPDTTAQAEDAPATTVPGPRCDPALLLRAATSYYPSARVADEACLGGFAISTVTSHRTGEAGVVVFYEADGDGWKLLKVDATDADVRREAPTGFPPALIAAWQGSYVRPTTSTTAAVTTSTRPATTPTTPSTTASTSTTSTTAEPPTSSTTEVEPTAPGEAPGPSSTPGPPVPVTPSPA